MVASIGWTEGCTSLYATLTPKGGASFELLVRPAMQHTLDAWLHSEARALTTVQ